MATPLSSPAIFLEGSRPKTSGNRTRAGSHSDNGRQPKRSQLKTDLEFPERQDRWRIVGRTDLTRRCNEVRNCYCDRPIAAPSPWRSQTLLAFHPMEKIE